MIRILFDVICKITFATLLIHSIVSVCARKKEKTSETTKNPATSPSPPLPPGNPYPAWRGRQKPMIVFDDKPSELSKKSSKIVKSVEESARTKQSSSLKFIDSGSAKDTKEVSKSESDTN